MNRAAPPALTSPQWMLLLGTLGMAMGLAVDAQALGLAPLLMICSDAPADLLSTMARHWQLMPAMHVGMALAGAASLPLWRALRPNCRRRLCTHAAQNIACIAAMVVGMSLGALLADRLSFAGFPIDAAGVRLAGMMAGMAWGMVTSLAVMRRLKRVTRHALAY